MKLQQLTVSCFWSYSNARRWPSADAQKCQGQPSRAYDVTTLRVVLCSTAHYFLEHQMTVIRLRLVTDHGTIAYFDYFHCVHTFFVKFQIKYLRYFILPLHVIYKYPSNIKFSWRYIKYFSFRKHFFHFHLQKNISFMKWNLPSHSQDQRTLS